MSTTPIAFETQLDKLGSQISELVTQYADIAYAPKAFLPSESAVGVFRVKGDGADGHPVAGVASPA